MDLRDLFQGQINDVLVDQISNQFGIKDRDQAQSAVEGGFTTLLNAISKNVATPSGAAGFAGALDRDHDGSVLDDIMGLVSGAPQQQAAPSRALNGAGILKHVLGGRQNNVIETISKASGLDKNSSLKLLVQMAPMLMGMLGKQKKEQKLDNNGLFDFLNSTKEEHNKTIEQPSMIERMLDQDGDGSMMDDLASFGLKKIGKLFRK